jgi:hypothetical protein
MMASCGAQLEAYHSLIDVQDFCIEYGDIITIYIRDESNINRDDYGDISFGKIEPNVISIPMSANPITFQPNQRQLEKAGLKDKCECLIYTPTLSWTTCGIEFDDIDMARSTVDYQGRKYVIKEKAQTNQISNVYLYITFGLYLK